MDGRIPLTSGEMQISNSRTIIVEYYNYLLSKNVSSFPELQGLEGVVLTRYMQGS